MLNLNGYSGLYSNQAGISEYVEMQEVKHKKRSGRRQRRGSEYVERQDVQNKKRSGRRKREKRK